MINKVLDCISLNSKTYCSRKTWSISPLVVVQGYRYKKPQSVSPAVYFARSAVRERRGQFPRRGNCHSALGFAPFEMTAFQKTMLAHPPRRFLEQHSLFILLIKVHARSVSEAFFINGTLFTFRNVNYIFQEDYARLPSGDAFPNNKFSNMLFAII